MTDQATRRAAVTHELKSRPHLFGPMVAGHKTHDMRRADRDFEVGDRVVLREHDHVTDTYSGRRLTGKISYITSETNPCALSTEAMAEGFALLSIKLDRASLLRCRLAGIRIGRGRTASAGT